MGGREPAFPDTGSPLPWDRERPPCPAQPGPPPREPGPCQGAGNAEGARGHRPLRRAPRGPLTTQPQLPPVFPGSPRGWGLPVHLPVGCALPMTRPAPRAPSAGRTLGQQQGTWPAARSRLRPQGHRDADGSGQAGAGAAGTGSVQDPAGRHGASRPPPAPHGCCAAIVAGSSGWPPRFPRKSWRGGRSSRHAGGGFCGPREGSPP